MIKECSVSVSHSYTLTKKEMVKEQQKEEIFTIKSHFTDVNWFATLFSATYMYMHRMHRMLYISAIQQNKYIHTRLMLLSIELLREIEKIFPFTRGEEHIDIRFSEAQIKIEFQI